MSRSCIDKGPTIFLVKSEKQKIFGGFSSVSWPGKDKSVSDKKAFLFSLTHKTKHNLQTNQELSLQNLPDMIILFGNKCDLAIMNHCDQSPASYSNFGWSFLPADDMKPGETKTMEYLAGSFFFKVLELEVYKLL